MMYNMHRDIFEFRVEHRKFSNLNVSLIKKLISNFRLEKSYEYNICKDEKKSSCYYYDCNITISLVFLIHEK